MKISRRGFPPPKGIMPPNGYSGNINLTHRPKFKQTDGSISTVNSMSINMDGKEILIPTIAIKNGNPAQLTPDEAIALFNATGKHLGMFDTPEEATKMANAIHKQQEYFYAK